MEYGRRARAVPGPGPVGGTGEDPALVEIRARLALALDFDDPVLALRWATRFRASFGVAKVGLELFSASGPSVVAALLDDGFKVFIDLKLADIPNTNLRAARVLGALGASYLTLHVSAGQASLRAGVEGFADGAEQGGWPAPVALGITVLTSEADAPGDLLRARVRAAEEAGCGGFVCAAADLAQAKAAAPGLLAVVPGIRLAGQGADDQSRAATPAAAARAGADLLVIGRAVTEAADPEAAVEALMAELAAVVAP